MSGQWWNDDADDANATAATPPASPPPGSPDMPTMGAAGSGGPPPSTPAAGPKRSGGGGGVPWPVVIAAVIALVGGLLAYSSFGGDDDGVALEGEIFLERADEAGADPFIDEYDTLVTFDPAEVTPPNAGSAGAANRPTSGASSGGSPPAAPLTNAEILALTFDGSEPGLYGGTGNNATCNKAALIAFLEENPEKGAAWAAAQDIEPADIRTFVEGLTTVALLADTRVTNHGFKNGVANPIQSVLQAGTAVMIDQEGIPRVKCGCGNPLRKPIPQSRTVVLQGDPWPEFDPAAIATVQPAEEPVDTFVLANPSDGTTVERPAGTDGEADAVLDTPAPQPLDDLAEAAVAAAAAVADDLDASTESAVGEEAGGDVSSSDTDDGSEADDVVEVEEEPDVDEVAEPEPEPEPESEPPPTVLDGATYCEKYASYLAEGDEFFFEDDDTAFIRFLRRAVADLASVAPPEVDDEWRLFEDILDRFSDAELLADSSPLFEGYDGAVDAANITVTDHARTVCGLDV